MNTTAICCRPGDKIKLSKIDPSDTGGLTKPQACARVDQLRGRLDEFQEKLYAEGQRSLVVIFQAPDTGGKDGAIKDLCAGINPAGLELARFKEPTPVERDHDFLWRAHKVVPGRGMLGIWNRSHYEDVLVARVHKLVPKKVWKTRYEQINQFEEILTENGTAILKFMLHISKEEQRERLQARIADPRKRWKFSPADLKERPLWDDYQKAYEDAINHCSTRHAPWYVIPANHKWARDLAVIDTVVHRLKKMKPCYPDLKFDPAAIVVE